MSSDKMTASERAFRDFLHRVECPRFDHCICSDALYMRHIRRTYAAWQAATAHALEGASEETESQVAFRGHWPGERVLTYLAAKFRDLAAEIRKGEG